AAAELGGLYLRVRDRPRRLDGDEELELAAARALSALQRAVIAARDRALVRAHDAEHDRRVHRARLGGDRVPGGRQLGLGDLLLDLRADGAAEVVRREHRQERALRAAVGARRDRARPAPRLL